MPDDRLARYHRSAKVTSNIKDIPDELPEGVERHLVEAEWNNVPLFDQPSWWNDENPPAFAKGKTWLQLLVDEWHEALLTPPTPEQVRSRALFARTWRAFEVDRTALAIECLVSKEAADRFRQESEPWVRDGGAEDDDE